MTSLGCGELRVGGGRWRERRFAELGQFGFEFFLQVLLQVATTTYTEASRLHTHRLLSFLLCGFVYAAFRVLSVRPSVRASLPHGLSTPKRNA